MMNTGKIGVAMTTYNRREVALNAIDKWRSYMPDNSIIIIVDDGSTTPFPNATFRFARNKGIAVAKNKCLELLIDAGCEHLFLVDDDIWPISSNWWGPYISSPEPHLQMLFNYDNNDVKNVGHIRTIDGHEVWDLTRGCMLYFERRVIDKVGGFNPLFKKYGYEHVELSDRIHRLGFTSNAYMDVIGSSSLFYSMDKYGDVCSSVPNQKMYTKDNVRLMRRLSASIDFVPYRMDSYNNCIILTSYFTGIEDPQSGIKRIADKNIMNVLIDSLDGLNLIVLNDCFDDDERVNVRYQKVRDCDINPYIYRYYVYRDWLLSNTEIESVFMVDAGDVEILKNPFYFIETGILYVGDEESSIRNKWLQKNHVHPVFNLMYRNMSHRPLLNAGIIGGHRDIIIKFLNSICSLFEKYNNSLGQTDMAAFNYICYHLFSKVLSHGPHVNTPFKQYSYNDISWFRHK